MTSAHKLTPDLFWQHSLHIYAQPGVAKACLALQDDYQVNVNLLLFYHWCFTVKQPVPQALQNALNEAIAATDPAIQNHRIKRRAAKGSIDYEALKQQELELEAAQQAELVTTYQTKGSESLNAPFNDSDPLVLMIEWLDLPNDAEIQHLITTVLQA